MFIFVMSFHTVLVAKGSPTYGAGIGFLSRVNATVPGQVILRGEVLPTHLTGIPLLLYWGGYIGVAIEALEMAGDKLKPEKRDWSGYFVRRISLLVSNLFTFWKRS